MKKLLFNISLILIVFLVSGCGYRVGSLLPKDIKTIAVPMFKNNTPEPEIETIITNGIIQEFILDGTLKVVEEDNADTLLLGEIIDYRREPIRYTKDEVTKEYRLVIAVKLRFEDLRRNEATWENPRVEGYVEFFVGSSLPESERENLPVAIKDLAHHVVEKVVEGGW
jgi:outer membrane lipopolysaccharide assembly protein LptE/RlpB